MISLNHGPSVWAEVMQTKKDCSLWGRERSYKCIQTPIKKLSSFNYNKDSVLLVVTIQVHCLLKTKLMSPPVVDNMDFFFLMTTLYGIRGQGQCKKQIQ